MSIHSSKTIHHCEELWENIQHLRQHLVARGAQLEKKGFCLEKLCVCVVMSCVWCAYSCSEVRRLLGQVQGFSASVLQCLSVVIAEIIG